MAAGPPAAVSRLGLILVNYNTAADTLAAVAALERQGVPLELVVVDNASRPDDQALLATLPPSVRLLRSETNLGYGGAINRALPLVTAPLVGFLNPDTRPFPGALARLVAALDADPGLGAVGPRTWWDEERTLLLPPIPLPTLRGFAARWLATRVPAFGAAYSRRQARRVASVGWAEGPRPMRMLSGAFVVARRSVMVAVAFDPDFPLYFEDADWCRRVGQAGHRLAYVPAAEIVHYFDQSARQAPEESERRRAASLRHYVRKYYGRAGLAAVAGLSRLGRERAVWSRDMEDLGQCSAPPEVRLPSGTGAVQIAHHGLFLDAAFGRVAAPVWRFPAPVWARLRPGRFFLRALAAADGRALRVWTWERVA
jgi:GT2 family glycosyltransferase